MSALNYKHLRYFWMVAKTGSIAKASEQLSLSPQSISTQISELEASLSVQLLRKVGRGLEPTEMGRRVFSYADEIFTIGNELLEIVHDQTIKKSIPFRIGIVDSVPKSVSYRIIEPALHTGEPLRLVCREGKLANLLSELSVNHLDMLIADRPMPANLNVRAYNHLLGESSISIFGTSEMLQSQGGRDFPANLDKAPILLPGDDSLLRLKLVQWFESQRIFPSIVAEFDDSAMLKSFGQAGCGFFAGHSTMEEDICRRYDVEVVGRIGSIVEQVYAITTERRLTHPAVVSVVQASKEIFTSPNR
jgi:LysR family transcriptional activator of nhaA